MMKKDESALTIGLFLIILVATWFFLTYLGPWIICLGVLCVIPSLFAPIIGSLSKKFGSNFLIGAIIFDLILFITLFGIPWFIPGFVLGSWGDYLFNKIYGSFIEWWWGFFNFLNPLGEISIPWGFYSLKESIIQIIIWVCFLILSTFLICAFYMEDGKDEREGSNEKEEGVEGKGRSYKKRVVEEEEKQLAKEEEELERKKREVSDPDPWSSGFL